MSYSNVPIFTQAIKTASASLSAASAWTPAVNSTTNLVALVTGGTNGSRVTSIILATTDTAANNVFLVLDPGGAGTALAILGQVNVPLQSGTTASVLAVDALSSTVTGGLPVDNNGKRFIHLAATYKLYISVVGAMTAGKVLFAAAQYENY